VRLTTHSGTHLDAPYHFHPTMNGRDGEPERSITIDEVPQGVDLIAGRTATVTVDTGRHPHNDKAGTAPTQAGL
jgi:hypothetical protein